MRGAPIKDRIKDRIKDHYVYGISYHELMRKVFPEDVYPKAWRHGTGGGPPGCAMAFGKALRSLGLGRSRDNKVGPNGTRSLGLGRYRDNKVGPNGS